MFRTSMLGLALCVAMTALPLRAQDAQSKDVSDIIEEQELLRRQLQRLRQTMEVLVPRLEAENRTHALQLLREGLDFLGKRRGESGALTVEELMDQAREDVSGGQLVSSLEKQQAIVDTLMQLLAILEDRENIEGLEAALEGVRELRAQMADAARREQRLEQRTAELGERAKSDAQRELEQKLEALAEEQRRLLEETERTTRDSGGLALEELARRLAELQQRQAIDSGVLEAWRPAEIAPLESAREPLAQARQRDARAERLERAAAELLAAAEAARQAASTGADPAATDEDRRASSAALTAAKRELQQASETAGRQQRASGDEAAQRAAEALEETARRLADAGASSDELQRAAERAEQRLAELRAQAAEERAGADRDRAEAREALEELSGAETGAGRTAERAREALERARQAAEQDDADAVARHTQAAARELQQGIDQELALSPMLAGSQSEQAAGTRSTERALESLADVEGRTDEASAEALRAAAEAAREAAEAMDAASEAARQGAAEPAASSAKSAAKALERARAELEQARSARRDDAGESAEQALAQAQQALAEQAAELGDEAPSASQENGGSLEPAAARRAEQALERASQAMQRAAESMRQGQSSSTAQSQREALEALDEARAESEAGTRASSAEDRSAAEELAREQRAIEKELLELAQRNRERDKSQPLPSLDRAAERAAEAAEALSRGELPEAQEDEQAVQRELAEAQQDLAEEEERYQRLRDEELLFRIEEEVRTLAESHDEALEATREVAAERQTEDDRPSRAQRFRLRRISQDELALAARARELATAIREEQTLVFAALLTEIADDLERVGERLDETGGYQTGDRVQALQQDIAESIAWLAGALAEERERREQEDQQQQEEQEDQQQGQQLVPDEAELKLLRRMELESRDRIQRLLVSYPDLEELGLDDPFLIEDIERLAERHERVSELFSALSERIGVPPAAAAAAENEDEDDGEER